MYENAVKKFWNDYNDSSRSYLVMPRKKKIPCNDLGIDEYEMESLARMVLPILKKYLESDEGKRDWQEWQVRIRDAKSTPNKIITEGTKLNDIN